MAVGSLASQTVRGAAWGVAAGLGSRLLGLVATLLLTRYLAPSEYGEVAIATIVVMTVYQFSTLAVGVYLTAHPDASDAVVFHATVLHVGLGVVGLGVSLAFGAFAGPWLEAPNLGRFVPWLAVAFFVDRVGSMPERMLLRKLRFSRVSGIRAAGELSYAFTSVALAVGGSGAMAIVWGNVVRTTVRACSFALSSGYREWLTPAKLERRTLAIFVTHGFWISLAGLFDFAARKWDNILVGKLFGAGVAGTYNLAYNLAELPALQVGEPINDVLQVSYAHAHEEERASALRRSIAILALVMGPLAFGFAAVADTITKVAFNQAWAGLAPMMTVLAVLSFLRPLEGAISSYLLARSVPRAVAIVDASGLALLLGVLWTVGRTSPTVACASVVGAVAVRGIFYFAALRARERIPTRPIAWAILPPLAASLVMAALVVLVARVVHLGPRALLAVQIAVGAIVYPVLAFVLARTTFDDAVGLIRNAIARRRG
jgi:PST family polysaccharide transporter